ncbi:PEP-CTERM sorting domain-containing protein [PVC group bacterium]|nr:PEP-CTERM sorting domain-containing protein [PVC group bacterium]
MKKNLFAILLAICVLSVAGTAHAVSFQLEQGYQYFFKYTNWEYIPDQTGFTSGVPDEIKGFYKVTTIQRAPAEIIGGVVVITGALDTSWWVSGFSTGEFIDGEFTLTLDSVVGGGVASWDAVLDMWLDTSDIDNSSLAAAEASFGDGNVGATLLAELESLFYETTVKDPISGTNPLGADGTGPNSDITAAATFVFTTNNTGIDWFTNPITGAQFGLTSSIFIDGGDIWDFTSQDPLTGTAPVPEPASLVLLGAGLVGFLKKRKSL